MKKVSVIIPMYESEAFVTACIRSVVGQTYRNLEILVIDDGSTDRGPQICTGFGRRDQRIRLLRQKHRGVSSARNRGIDAATGEYLFFLDSDDLIHPRLIETLVSYMEDCRAQYGLCRMVKHGVRERKRLCTDDLFMNSYCSGGVSADGFSKEAVVWEMVEGQETEDWFFGNNRYPLISIGGKMARRDWIGKLRFQECLQNGEDTLFMYQVICRRARMVYLDMGWYYYQMNPKSHTHSLSAIRDLNYAQSARIIRDREYRKNRPVYAVHWEKLLLRQMEKTARAMYGTKRGKDWRRLKKRAAAERKHPLFQEMTDGTKRMFTLCFYCHPLYVPLNLLRPAVWKIRSYDRYRHKCFRQIWMRGGGPRKWQEEKRMQSD